MLFQCKILGMHFRFISTYALYFCQRDTTLFDIESLFFIFRKNLFTNPPHKQ